MKPRNTILLVLVCPVLVFSALNVTGGDVFQVYVPPTPASIPLIVAADNVEGLKVSVFANHTQAHTLFLRGDIPLLVTGLSVGIRFFENGVPVQIINTYVSGMTCLVTRGKKVENFRQLKGLTIIVPFEGSPIEEITKFFVAQEGLDWKKDFNVEYAPLETALELLKIGKTDNIVLPQPFIAMALLDDDIYNSINYKTRWDIQTNSQDGYPQVGTFVNKEWAKQHRRVIKHLNLEIAKALIMQRQNPAQAIKRASALLGYSEALTSASLASTDFVLKTSWDLRHYIELYYTTLGKPLNETYQPFFYLDPQ